MSCECAGRKVASEGNEGSEAQMCGEEEVRNKIAENMKEIGNL